MSLPEDLQATYDAGLKEETRLIDELVGVGFSQRATLAMIGLSRSAFQYRRAPRPRVKDPVPQAERNYPTRLTETERATIVKSLETSGVSIEETFYRDLDAKVAPASLVSYHRIARAEGIQTPRTGSRKRRALEDQKVVPAPVLKATGPGQVLCWDITFIPGKHRGESYAAYVVIDLYSRYIVGYTVQRGEDKHVARDLLRTIIESSTRRVHTVHSDNGGAMTSTVMKAMLTEKNVAASYIRPGVSNDNAQIESLFRTAKYSPRWPGSFDSIAEGYEWLSDFTHVYNTKHHHSGIAGFTPEQVYTGTWRTVHKARQEHLDALYAQNPGRFRKKPPQAATPPHVVSINLTNDTDPKKALVPTCASLMAA